MVIMSIEFPALYKLKRKRLEHSAKRDLNTLSEDEVIKKRYQASVEANLQQDRVMSTTERYEVIKNSMLKAANDTLPLAPKKINGKVKYVADQVIIKLSHRQRELTKAIYNKGSKKRNPEKLRKLKRARNKTFKQLRKRQQELDEERLNRLATELESSKGTRASYEFARIMSKNKSQSFTLYDSNKNKICKDSEILEAVKNHYEIFFSRAGDTPLDPWIGEAKTLKKKITAKEIGRAASKLKNNRALGPDGVAGELIKHGNLTLHLAIANLINDIFATHDSVTELKAGYLFPLNKPGKARIVTETRPLVFLVIMRKVLSNVALIRIKGKVERFLSLNQHAYRSGRSTTEVTWTAQWVSATSEKYAELFHSSGLDLSKAFDCMTRTIIMRILQQYKLATEDEMRIIQFLISETTLRVKLGQSIGETFETIIGAPQGDCLSPILFLIYLEHILRSSNINKYLTQTEQAITTSYADDVNFYTIDRRLLRPPKYHPASIPYASHEKCKCAACRAHNLITDLKPHFAKFGMEINNTKTTHEEFVPKYADSSTLKMLGNHINTTLELQYRRISMAAAVNAMEKIWSKGRPISTGIKLRLLEACATSRLIYNAHCIPYTRAQLDKVNSTHRRHIRRALGVYYPERISVPETYRRAEAEPLSVRIVKSRWTMFGHILRQRGTPANQAMSEYFRVAKSRIITRRIRALTTLPKILHSEILRLTEEQRSEHLGVTGMSSQHDLNEIWRKAQNRNTWRDTVELITENEREFVEARDASTSEKRITRASNTNKERK